MITLLIVEDEQDTRDGLKKFIPWSDLGVGVVYDASNGLAAVDICESISPDILVTDVRMPKMDGIQLAFYIRDRFPECRIIFLSGYSDKDYLKAAIKLGAVSYIEKPINLEEVKSVVSQAVQLCEESAKQKEKEEYLQSIVSKRLLFNTQKLAVELAVNALTDETLVELRNLWPEEKSNNQQFTSAIIKISNQSFLSEEEAERTRFYIFRNVSECNELDNLCAKVVAGFLDNNKIVLHFNRALIQSDELTCEILQKFYNNILKDCDKWKITIAVGKPVSHYSELYKSFQSAMQAIKEQFLIERGEIVFFEEHSSSTYVFPDLLYDTFYEYLHANKRKDTIFFIEHLAASISCYRNTDIGYIKNVFYKLFRILEEVAEDRNVAISEAERGGLYYWQEISKMESLSELASYLKAYSNLLFAAIEDRGSQARTVDDIICYIEKNYTDHKLSVKEIAENTHYDYYYLCTLFKKNTGITINDCITQVRMKKAMELIKQSDIKLYDIAGMVGYSDSSYFTKIFKKQVGITPSEFREMY